jgi:hypothetical protein
VSTKIQTQLVAAQREICAKGIAKLNTADTGAAKYRFRGVEQAMNEMSPILVNHGITVTARYSDLSIMERVKGDPKDGKASRFVTLKGAFTFAADDGSNVTSEVYGEAMDSGDKAVIKAQSVAFRTALFQQFVVPTMAMDTELDGEDDDSEAEMLDGFRSAAMQGSLMLKDYWAKHKPSEDFWKRHGEALKAAAAAADKGAS